jgi:putative pyruvate formate lyase activating enzyme
VIEGAADRRPRTREATIPSASRSEAIAEDAPRRMGSAAACDARAAPRPEPFDAKPAVKAFAKPSVEEKRALLELRGFNDSAAGRFTYNSGGNIIVDPSGAVSFSDLTMELVPLARTLNADEAQRRRLAELRVDWPGGPDPRQRTASYVELVKNGEIDRRISEMREIRARDRFGLFARAGAKELKLGGYNLNVGEERAISGTQGSGTIYFSSCSMKCSFCQYADIAQMKGGVSQKPEDLARMMLELQERGAHNIQLMTPSHYAVEILEALKIGAERGLRIPLVWNSGGMEDLDALRALEGVVDIYLPDLKFGSDASGRRYGRVEGYLENTLAAIREMYRQVGPLETDAREIATRGLAVRHLVMPANAAESDRVAEALSAIAKDIPVSLLGGWVPSHAAFQTPEINRKLTDEEYRTAHGAFSRAGFRVLLEPWEEAKRLGAVAPPRRETPNALLARAWSLRAALAARLESLRPEADAPGARFLRALLERLETGAARPDEVNRALLFAEGALCPEGSDVEAAAARLVEAKEEALKRLFAGVAPIGERDALRVEATRANKVRDLGSEIAAACRAAPARARAFTFLEEVPFVPPYALGVLAKDNGADDAAAFVAKLEAATPDQRKEAAAWLDGVGSDWSRIENALSFSPAPRPAKDAPSLARSIARDPDRFSRSRRRRARWAAGLAEGFGLDEGAMRIALRAREREAANALGRILRSVESAIGKERARTFLSRIDVDRQIERLADLRDGMFCATDLDSPALMREKEEKILAGIAEELLLEAGDVFRARLERDPRFSAIAAAIASRPKRAPYVRAAIADVLVTLGGEDPWSQGPRGALEKAASWMRDEHLDRALENLAAEMRDGAEAMVGELEARLRGLLELEREVRADGRARARLESHLAAGVLPISRSAVEALERHMEAAYPYEGMGYLASDGRTVMFLPVRNSAHGSELGRTFGLDSADDARGVAELVERAGLRLVAKVHSHPDDDACPSETDLTGMRSMSALMPGLRTVIDSVRRDGARFFHRLASFSSGADGQVIGEDRVEVT